MRRISEFLFNSVKGIYISYTIYHTWTLTVSHSLQVCFADKKELFKGLPFTNQGAFYAAGAPMATTGSGSNRLFILRGGSGKLSTSDCSESHVWSLIKHFLWHLTDITQCTDDRTVALSKQFVQWCLRCLNKYALDLALNGWWGIWKSPWQISASWQKQKKWNPSKFSLSR